MGTGAARGPKRPEPDDSNAVTEPAPSPEKSLGERCLEWCRYQAARSSVPDLETLASWFEPCERDGKQIGTWLAESVRQGTRHNHCAAAQCAATLACLLADEPWPHGYRAAAKELMRDALERGCWHKAEECVDGLWLPMPGDLAIYDRSIPGEPQTAWHGHVDRVIQAGERFYSSIGANEVGGRWREEAEQPYTNKRLLGFVALPQQRRRQEPSYLLGEDEVEQVRGLVAMTLDQAEEAMWDEWRRH